MTPTSAPIGVYFDGNDVVPIVPGPARATERQTQPMRLIGCEK